MKEATPSSPASPSSFCLQIPSIGVYTELRRLFIGINLNFFGFEYCRKHKPTSQQHSKHFNGKMFDDLPFK